MPTNPLPHPRPNTPAPVPEITHFGARDFLNERLPGRRSECPVDSWAWAWPRRNTMGATLLGPCLQAPQGRSRLARFGCFPGSGLPLVGLAGNRPSVAYFSVACFDLSPPPFQVTHFQVTLLRRMESDSSWRPTVAWCSAGGSNTSKGHPIPAIGLSDEPG